MDKHVLFADHGFPAPCKLDMEIRVVLYAGVIFLPIQMEFLQAFSMFKVVGLTLLFCILPFYQV